jgi:hypothetical protein
MFMNAAAGLSDIADAEPSGEAVLELLTADLALMPARPARDAFEFLRTGRSGDLPDVWDGITGRLPELCDRLARIDPDLSKEAKGESLYSLTWVTAGAMIPALAHAGRFTDAVRLARAYARAVMRKEYRRIPGAGGKLRGYPNTRFLLLAPVLWSLLANSPDDGPGQLPG